MIQFDERAYFSNGGFNHQLVLVTVMVFMKADYYHCQIWEAMSLFFETIPNQHPATAHPSFFFLNRAFWEGGKSIRNKTQTTADFRTTLGVWLVIFMLIFLFFPSLRGVLQKIIFDSKSATMSGWWFQIFFIFTPKLGKDFQFGYYFSIGLVQPPTRCSMKCIS